MTTPPPQPGGFLPSPPTTTPTPSSPSSSLRHRVNLPHPRAHPLRPNSAKEDATRRFVDSKLLHISRRYVKKFQVPEGVAGADGIEVAGYTTFGEVCADLGEVVDVLWLSGTPSLQIPYLLNVALAISSYLLSFPPDSSATFTLLRKLDHAFASLLLGTDIESGEVLPGFEDGRKAGLSRTDMVRCNSLIMATRTQVVEVMAGVGRSRDENGNEDGEEEGTNEKGDRSVVETDTETDVDTDTDMDEAGVWDGEDDGQTMEIARVYEKTLVQLGKSLSSSSGYDAGGGG